MNEPRRGRGRSLVPEPKALGHVSDAPPITVQAAGATWVGVLALLLGLAGVFALGFALWSSFNDQPATPANPTLQAWVDRANLPFLTHLPWSTGVRWGITLGSLLAALVLLLGKLRLSRRIALATSYWLALTYCLCWAQDPTSSTYGSWLQGRGWLFALVALVPIVLPATGQRTYLTAGAVALAPALALLLKARLEGLDVGLLDALQTIDGLALLVLAFVHAARSTDWRALNEAARRASWHLSEVEAQSERALVWTPGKNLFKRDVVVEVGKTFPLSQQQRSHFEADAMLACALHSPQMAMLFDFGLSTRGEPYLVRERVVGHSFEQLVSKHGAQLPERTLYLLGNACHALAEAAELGLVHGALTPAALWLVQRSGEYDLVKVCNFAHQHWPAQTGPLPTDAEIDVAPKPVRGVTPKPVPPTGAYRAPERSGGKFVPSPEADVYAIGCIGYWLFLGRPPFIGDAEALERHHAGTQAPSLSQLAGMAPPKDLESILQSCLAKNPSERPTMATLRRRLLSCAAATHWTQTRAKDWWQRYPAELRGANAKFRTEARFTLRSLFGDE